MPAAPPLIDFTEIDLSRTVVGREDLLGYLRQRNRFEMLDGIVHVDLEGKVLVGYKDIKQDDWWAEDHIPGRPMFPGALQIEVAAQLATYDYSAHRYGGPIPDDVFVGFGGVEKVRFRGLVEPDCRLYMAVHLTRNSRRMFRYTAQGFVDRELVFQGDIIGVLV
ncbi:MAG: beta-hydroxyacyl-ACP dehydratase [Planctomycetota bacterium]|nr:beta-hydroxyacyl-ACP dehydratase [Planctomycetota bacterium]